LKRRLFDLLACPICGDSFSLRVLKEEDAPSFQPSSIPCQDRCLWKEERGFSGITVEDCARCYGKEILEGIVICPDGHEFAVSGGILRTLGKREKREPGGGEEFFHSLKRHGGVKATFDREWRMVDAGQEIYGHSPEAEEEDFFRRLCVKENFLRGKLLLDVGSGIGRLADRLTRKAAEVVGVELSDGVDRAWERLHTNPRVHFIQGNLFTLPLRPRTFDYVYSKGVFQYVSNPREAFRRVARSVRPGGGFSITLYPPLPPFFFILNRSIRALTLRLPLGWVEVLSFLAVPFLPTAWRASGVEKRRIPMRDRGHMIFNWLAADYQNFHSTEEVVSWYREEGFGNICTSPIPVGVFGQWEGNGT
jgi:SAM-dependent methyltransferase/uncharacterized protein YbaR (Trm112 family)